MKSATNWCDLASRTAIFVLALATNCAIGQAPPSLLLSHPVRISGIVVDSDGKPLAEAHFLHANDYPKHHATDADGKFDFETDAPAVVVYKEGFTDVRLLSEDGANARVVLQRLTDIRPFPVCSSTEGLLGVYGLMAQIKFQKARGIKASKPYLDTDFWSRSYKIKTNPQAGGILHASGAMWGGTYPFDEFVWAAKTYQETVYTYDEPGLGINGIRIIDYRGLMANGKRWRFLGKISESASYGYIDEETAQIFDSFLDHACIRQSPPPVQ